MRCISRPKMALEDKAAESMVKVSEAVDNFRRSFASVQLAVVEEVAETVRRLHKRRTVLKTKLPCRNMLSRMM